MADADNQNETPDSQGPDLRSEINTKFTEMSQKLVDMQANWQNSLQAVASSVAKPEPKGESSNDFFADDGYTIDPSKIEARASAAAQQAAQNLIARERQRDEVITRYAADYPEMQTVGSEFNQAILAAHKTLPQSLQGTPEGYEMAILRAASSTGVVPKSKRSSNEDFSLSGTGKNKPPKSEPVTVSEDTQAFAELLNRARGRDVNSKEVQEGLKKAASRKDYNRYR